MFPGTDSKLELRLNKIQYLNKDAVNVASKSVLLAADVILLGSLSNDDGDGNENDKKKALGLDKENNNFTRASRFFCTFLCRCCTTTT